MQSFAMLAYGYFVFNIHTAPYQQLSRELSWQHPTNEVMGRMPKTQFTGKAGETITLNGSLFPEVSGGTLSLKLLEMLAESGKPYPLISGSTFMVLGWFVVESLSETSSTFFADGTARKIEFDLKLKRVDDSLLADIADVVDSFL